MISTNPEWPKKKLHVFQNFILKREKNLNKAEEGQKLQVSDLLLKNIILLFIMSNIKTLYNT